jgi:hypothetical protein
MKYLKYMTQDFEDTILVDFEGSATGKVWGICNQQLSFKIHKL